MVCTIFNFYIDDAIHMALDVHRREERGIKVDNLLDADLVGNRWNLILETLVTDLEYADDMALWRTTGGTLPPCWTALLPPGRT